MVALMLSDDLIFTSRVRGTASAAGGVLHNARQIESLKALLRQHRPRCIIVDLQFPGLQINELVLEAKQLQPTPQLIGYGSHVDVETLRAARIAGFDVVMPRSQFVERLESAMPIWLTAESDAADEPT